MRLFLAALVIVAPSVARAANVDECMKSYESAQEQKQQHHLVAAREALRVCAQSTCPKAARADCVPWLASIDTEIPSVVFSAKCDGKPFSGDVSVDGAPLANALDGMAREVDPGMRTFTLRGPDGKVWSSSVAVREGGKNQPVDFAVDAGACGGDAAPSSSSSSGKSSRLPWVIATASVGVVATGLFAGFGLSGVLRRSDMIHSCFPRCDPDEVSSVRTALTIADVSWITAGVAFVAAAVLYFTDPTRGKTSSSLAFPMGVQSF